MEPATRKLDTSCHGINENFSESSEPESLLWQMVNYVTSYIFSAFSSKNYQPASNSKISVKLPHSTPPAYIHAGSFAKGQQTCPINQRTLTPQSIWERQNKLKDKGYPTAYIRRTAVVTAIGDEPTVEHACSFVNEARSGIWNIDGTLNVERLEELKKRCIVSSDNVTKLITRSIFQNFINERRAELNQTYWPHFIYFGNLTWVKPIPFLPFKIPVPFTAVTDGSVDAFFHTYSTWNCNGEDAVIWEDIVDFYDPKRISEKNFDEIPQENNAELALDIEEKVKKD